MHAGQLLQRVDEGAGSVRRKAYLVVQLHAAGVHALSDLKVRVPDDVGVIGINNSQYAELCVPALTSLDNMLHDLSLTAARNIRALLDGERINKKMMICSRIVERQST